MKQQPASLSLKLCKAAKSTLAKTAFLTISALALGSTSAYAQQAGSTVKKLYSFDGIGDAVVVGAQTNPDVYSQINLVDNTGWEPSNFGTLRVAQCTVSDTNTCEVELVGNKVQLSLFQKTYISTMLSKENAREEIEEIIKQPPVEKPQDRICDRFPELCSGAIPGEDKADQPAIKPGDSFQEFCKQVPAACAGIMPGEKDTLDGIRNRM